MHRTPRLSGWPRALALVATLLCACATTRAESGEATDAAFGALLAMPGAQPKDGGWHIPVPAAKDEADLIAQLRQLKKDGANFNAMRHRGTLLAHAIRAGKDRTAIWLLHNGATPRHVLFGIQDDAHDLALLFKRADVALVLEREYGFAPHKPTPAKKVAADVAAPAASSAPPSHQQQIIDRMRAMVAPGVPDAAAEREWLAYSATLSQADWLALFKDGANIELLVHLTRNSPQAFDEALSRLPLALVRQQAQAIADLLAQASYRQTPHAGASLSWPALWKRIDQPLRYDKAPDLAARVPPTSWPALFASGYAEHDADVTGCTLAEADLPALKALWPDFERHFTNAREEAPGLVLANYWLGRDDAPCRGSDDPARTVARLAFLKEQGVTSLERGLRSDLLEQANDPALVAMAASFAPQAATQPRLTQIPPSCDLAIDTPLLDAFINARGVGWGVPARLVHALEVPGHAQCGWVVSGDAYDETPTQDDDFFNGPFREGSARCGDLADDLDIWVEETGRVVVMKNPELSRGVGLSLRPVRDSRTGKLYLLDDGLRGAQCSPRHGLPDAFEWQVGPAGPSLRPSPDDAAVARLLRQQCEQGDSKADVACQEIEPVGPAEERSDGEGLPILATLQQGGQVTLARLVDWSGRERRAAFAAAIAAHDHAATRRLVAEGIPPRWTGDEIQALAKADLPLEEKRRRVALLFANPGQLAQALYATSYGGAAQSLLSWLPYQDWGPVLRVIEGQPDLWRERANELRGASVEAGRDDLACAIDHAQGYLCGGWIETD